MTTKTKLDRSLSKSAWDAICAIYDHRATRPYGLSGVNQREHALQAASLAVDLGCGDDLVIAALLHDVGHMVHCMGDHPAADGVDDRHERIGADWIAQFFPISVHEPVRLHVAAKRYLCTVETDYLSRLSADSVQSLRLQGGLMTFDEKYNFEGNPFHSQAVILRRLDERAKRVGVSHTDLQAFRSNVERLLDCH